MGVPCQKLMYPESLKAHSVQAFYMFVPIA